MSKTVLVCKVDGKVSKLGKVSQGKWTKVSGEFLTEKAYGICSICGQRSELKVEPYYLALDVTGLDKCPNCNSDMEFYFKSFDPSMLDEKGRYKE